MADRRVPRPSAVASGLGNPTGTASALGRLGIWLALTLPISLFLLVHGGPANVAEATDPDRADVAAIMADLAAQDEETQDQEIEAQEIALPAASSDVAAARAVGPSNSSPIAITSNGARLLSVNPDNNNVTFFNVANNANQAIARVAVGREPRSVAISPDDRFALVTNQAAGTVSLLSIQPPRNLGSFRVGGEPYGVAFTPEGDQAWVTNAASSQVHVIERRPNAFVLARSLTLPASIRGTIENPSLRGIAITNLNRPNDEQFAYVTQFFSQLAPGGRQATDNGRVGKVHVFSTRTFNLIRTITMGPRPTGFEADRTVFGGSPNTPTNAFPNQLQAIAIKGNRAYLPNVAASPEGPIRFDVTTQAFLGVINTSTNVEAGGQNINLNVAVKQQTATPKLFLAVPWAVAFERRANEGYVVSAASNVLAKIRLAADGGPSVVVDNAGGQTRVREIAVGKNPLGLVINSTDTRAYVMNYISRDVSVVDLTQSPEREIARIRSAPLPPPRTDADRVHVGKELFNTSVGEFDQTDPATGQPVRGRMSNNGWQACVSCHPSGWTDSVVWAFGTGPRKSVPLDATFNPRNRNEQRVLNYSSIFDEVEDFENNIRAVSGGQGVIVLPGTITQDPVLNAFALPNTARNQLTVRGFNGMDAVSEFVRRDIRSPISPESANDPLVRRGRDLFTRANCQGCHGGSLWTSSVRDYTPPPPPGELAQGVLPEQPAQFLVGFLRQVGTFNPADPIERSQVNNVALGRQGFSPPSLLGIYTHVPYNHHGNCQTLACVLENPAHRRAGVVADILGNPADRAALVKFVRSIDESTTPIQANLTLDRTPANLQLTRGTQGSYQVSVGGSSQVSLELTGQTLPSGIGASLTPGTGQAPFQATLTLTAGAQAAVGQHYLELCGRRGTQRLCIVLGLNVVNPPAP